MVKKGDTLIEVTLAIGIFSMVAIAITSVMSGATANTQTALETTLAREEIDTQAEALRFIHAAYAADKNTSYPWKTIINSRAINPTDSAASGIQNYAPTDCNGNVPNKAFIINPKTLAIVTDSSKFVKTETFPQLSISGSNLEARGIYVVAIKEKASNPTYYDFYIQTCWYGANANEASTISTLVRLHNPDSI